MSLEVIKIRKKLRYPPNHYPRFLYKYKSVEPISHVRDIVIESRLWYSSPADFNDPFDTKIEVSASGTAADIIRRIKKALSNSNNSQSTKSSLDDQATRVYAGLKRNGGDLAALAAKSHEETMASCGIICFSEDPKNILLWSHYGCQHKGICFQFEIANDPDNFCCALTANYATAYPVHDWVKDNDRKLFNGILTKFEGWRYEAERRIVLPSAAHKYLNFKPGALRAIILGCKISDDDNAKIMRLVHERQQRSLPSIKIYKTSQSKTSYSLQIYNADHLQQQILSSRLARI